jgi:DMSO/TMAO reductase YedYZ heme-binding membrane subunit
MARRLYNHSLLIACSAMSLGIAVISGPAPGAADRLSIVSAYLCLFLLAMVLLIGPWSVVKTGRKAVNIYVRRDIGIWAALTGLMHFYLANVLSMNYEYLGIFVENAALPPSAEIRSELYSWGTISGYVIAVFFIILIGLSSDRSMRFLGVKWWKRIQRISYVAFVLTCVHGFAFQVLESREMFWFGVIGLVILMALTGQVLGIASVRKTRAPKNRSTAAQ